MAVTTIASTTSSSTLRGASTDDLDSEYLAAAIEFERERVDTVPGSGPILGVWYYNGNTYAFRCDELDLECKMHVATDEGWVEVDTGVTRLTGGRYDFINYNFGASTSSTMMYGVDGVNKGFQFDGTTFTEITTGMTVDTPIHLTAHKGHLFYAFEGGSVQHSSITDPLTWSAITGAAELGLGDECTGFSNSPGGVLIMMCRNSNHILSGSSTSDWAITTYSDQAGALEWSVQRRNYPLYLDDRGVTSLSAVQDFGDFKSMTLSQKIQKYISSIRSLLVASVIIKDKDQYRLYFSNGIIITMSFDGDTMIGMAISEYDTTMTVVYSMEDDDGNEIILAGSDDGYVYHLDSGTSFDGGAIDAWIRPSFSHLNTPVNDKRYFKTTIEINADQAMDLYFVADYNYGSADYPSAIEDTLTVSGGGGAWDGNDTYWEDFYYDSQFVSTAYAYTEGVGTNFSLLIRSNGTYEKPHTIQGAIVHFSLKGIKR